MESLLPFETSNTLSFDHLLFGNQNLLSVFKINAQIPWVFSRSKRKTNAWCSLLKIQRSGIHDFRLLQFRHFATEPCQSSLFFYIYLFAGQNLSEAIHVCFYPIQLNVHMTISFSLSGSPSYRCTLSFIMVPAAVAFGLEAKMRRDCGSLSKYCTFLNSKFCSYFILVVCCGLSHFDVWDRYTRMLFIYISLLRYSKAVKLNTCPCVLLQCSHKRA